MTQSANAGFHAVCATVSNCQQEYMYGYRLMQPATAQAALVQFPTSRLKNRYILVSRSRTANTLAT
jgi:hypothetical protein